MPFSFNQVIKIGELSDIIRQSGIRPDLEEKFLEACIRDIFVIDLTPFFRFPQNELFGRIWITPTIKHSYDLIIQNSLSNQLEKLLGIAFRVQDYILKYCTTIGFQSAYMTNVRGITDTIGHAYYHERDKEPVDKTERSRFFNALTITSLIGGGVAGAAGTYATILPIIASNPHLNALTQASIWGGAAYTGAFIAYWFINSRFRGITKISKAEDYILGDEFIIHGEITLDRIQDYLRMGYDDLKPPEEASDEKTRRYSGKMVRYVLPGEMSYMGFIRRSESSLNLQKWLANHPNSPLFQVALISQTSSNIVGSWILEMKVEDKIYAIHETRSFRYNKLEKDPEKTTTQYRREQGYLLNYKHPILL